MPGWILFACGLALGAALVWLWMRTQIAEIRAREQTAEAAAAHVKQTFQSIADAALRSNQTAFLAAANSSLEAKHAAIDGLVKPLGDSLGRLETHVRELERERQRIFGGLGEQLQTLSRETGTLASALRTPHVRGRWGEITLRRAAELSGMSAHCDFFEQQTRETDAGNRIRPDMIVRLPGNRSLVVDAKAPLTAYLEAASAADEKGRRAAIARHAQQVAEHVKHLGSKQYWNQFQPTPELVVLFLPGEQFFGAALEANPDLIEDALARKVVIATPVTLISVLKGIAYGWNQERLADNAEHIRRVASEFCDRLESVYQHYAEVGRQLERTVDCYNRSAGSWDSRLVPSLRKLRELGIPGESDPAPPALIDVVPRRPRAVNE